MVWEGNNSKYLNTDIVDIKHHLHDHSVTRISTNHYIERLESLFHSAASQYSRGDINRESISLVERVGCLVMSQFCHQCQKPILDQSLKMQVAVVVCEWLLSW